MGMVIVKLPHRIIVRVKCDDTCKACITVPGRVDTSVAANIVAVAVINSNDNYI